MNLENIAWIVVGAALGFYAYNHIVKNGGPI